MLIDVHAHLTDASYGGRGDELAARTNLVEPRVIIDTGSDIDNSEECFRRAERCENIYCAVGVHPEFADKYDEQTEKRLREMAKGDKTVAIGETGLDYHFENNPPRDAQKAAFEAQIRLADACGLPVVVHVRDAHGDAVEVLKRNKAYLGHGLLIHCYSGSKELFKEYDKLDAYYSFGGAVTFKNAKDKPDVLRACRLDRLLLETDCPYMAPEPFRGRQNLPEYIAHTADKVAGILGVERAKLEEITTANAMRLFGRIHRDRV